MEPFHIVLNMSRSGQYGNMNVLLDFFFHDVVHNGGAGRFQTFHRQKESSAAHVKTVQLPAQRTKMLTADGDNDDVIFSTSSILSCKIMLSDRLR